MTTINTLYYHYRPKSFTGVESQPNIITTFSRREGKKIRFQSYIPIYNLIGITPFLGTFFGAMRLAASVKKFLKNDREKKTKVVACATNFSIGIIEMIPLVNTVVLGVFYAASSAYFSHKINKKYSMMSDIAGIAVDGKVACTIDRSTADKLSVIHGENGAKSIGKTLRLIFEKAMRRPKSKRPHLKAVLQKTPEILNEVAQKTMNPISG